MVVGNESCFYSCHGLDPMTCTDSELVLKLLILSRNPLMGVRPIHTIVSRYNNTAQKMLSCLERDPKSLPQTVRALETGNCVRLLMSLLNSVCC
jgi:hypothetical protein